MYNEPQLVLWIIYLAEIIINIKYLLVILGTVTFVKMIIFFFKNYETWDSITSEKLLFLFTLTILSLGGAMFIPAKNTMIEIILKLSIFLGIKIFY
jgi:hypothetical protein